MRVWRFKRSNSTVTFALLIHSSIAASASLGEHSLILVYNKYLPLITYIYKAIREL